MKIKDAVRQTIASNIRRARTNANMTQAEAAEQLGITAQAISNFERGVNGVENSLLLRMCDIYHTSMSYILGEEEDSPSEVTLTEGEKEMLELFRLIPVDRQPEALELLRVTLKMMQKP